MKLLILFTVITCLQASARSYGQTVSLSLQNAPLEKAFKEIKKQTGYSFVYTRTQLKNTLPITYQVKNGTLKDVLEQCFRNQPLSFVIEDKYIVVQTKTASIQTNIIVSDPIDITGRVVNENGEVLEGVTITAKKSGKMTISNAKGEFSLKSIDDDDVLVLTSVGYITKEIPVNKESNKLISLTIAVGNLDETIVIAYGKTTRRYSTGNISSIKSDELSRQPVSDPINILGGKVPGLQIIQNSGVPGSLITVRLRGRNSIANGNDPLYIVDGIPFPSTTLSGSFGGGASIASSPFNNLNPADIESIEILKDADATAIYGSRGANGVILITTKKGKQGKLKANVRMYAGFGKVSDKMQLLNTQEYIEMRKEAFANDGTTPTVANARDLLLWDTTRYTNWQAVLIGNTSQVTDVNANISGGSEQTQFLFSTGYRRETTVFPGEFGQSKYSGNLNLTHKTSDNKLNISLNTSYTFTDNILPQQDFSNLITLSPNAPAIYKDDGSLNWENSTWTNPWAAVYSRFITKTDNSITNLNVSYKITKALEFSVNAGLSSIATKENMITPKKSFDPAFGFSATAGFGNKSIKTIIVEPQLNYRRQREKSELEILIGSTAQSTQQTSLYQVGLGYTSDDLLYSLRAASSILTASESDISYRYIGLFGRINYNLNKRYLSTITIRRDGSSRYGVSDRFANFGSIGLGWIFSNEAFLKNFKPLSFGKLKASAGITGNDQIGDYKYLNLYAPGMYPYQGVTGFYPTQLFNPLYNWEKVTKLEVGLETGFFENRMLLNLSFYRNITTNQLVEYALPTITGFGSVLQNIPAKILNKGVEIELTGTVIRSKHFQWVSTANLTIPRNKLLSFDGIESSTYANLYVIGQPLFIEKKYKHTGVDPATGNHTFMDYDGDGRITAPNDQQAIINTGQAYYGGWQNIFSYRKLSLVLLFQFAKQPHIQNYLARFSRPGLIMNQPDLILQRWRNPSDISPVQKYANSNTASNRAFTSYRQSDAALTDGSFLRFKNFQIAYSITPKIARASTVSELQFFMQGQNIFTLTKYIGLDPETKTLLPPVRSLTFGINMMF
jgi:TonB-linked SusC/RagA family outer membrane protein